MHPYRLVRGAPRQRTHRPTAPPGRSLVLLAFGLLLASPWTAGGAVSLQDLTAKDASAGLRSALGQGIDRAVDQLGVADGFLGNPQFAIPLPPALQKAERALRLVGMSGDADELHTAMNRAAEAAVAAAKPVFRQALQRMTIADAKGILTGGDDAATQYFRRTTGEQLAAKFRPIVARETAKARLGALYDRYAGQAAQFGLVRSEDANLDDYVTARALDALYGAIAAEERAIRRDPVGQASAIVRKVFGAL